MTKRFVELLGIAGKHERIDLSVSSICRIPTSASILNPRKYQLPKPHRRRHRKEREGMLIQIDATSYHWFSKDYSPLALVGGIGDATGKIVGAIFRNGRP